MSPHVQVLFVGGDSLSGSALPAHCQGVEVAYMGYDDVSTAQQMSGFKLKARLHAVEATVSRRHYDWMCKGEAVGDMGVSSCEAHVPQPESPW